jgi:hypothetical protein
MLLAYNNQEDSQFLQNYLTKGQEVYLKYQTEALEEGDWILLMDAVTKSDYKELLFTNDMSEVKDNNYPIKSRMGKVGQVIIKKFNCCHKNCSYQLICFLVGTDERVF